MTGSSQNAEILQRRAGDAANDWVKEPEKGSLSAVAAHHQMAVGVLLHEKIRLLQDFREYRDAKAKLGDVKSEFNSLFKRFLATGVGRRCLRLLFETDNEPELGPNWVTHGLDSIECRADGTNSYSLDLEDESFDAVLCTGLERVAYPENVISEVSRVLKRAGQLWVQVPLNSPYDPTHRPGQHEYWRITPNGLRVLLTDFDEIMCSVFLPGGSALRNWSFFYGLKPTEPADGELHNTVALPMAPA